MSKIPPELEAQMTPAVKAFVLALFVRIDQLTEQVEVQNKQITKLNAQVESLTDQLQKLTPRNSSIPPSTEHPHAKPPSKKMGTKGKIKQGGQKGHKRHVRKLVPTEGCTSVTPLHPVECRRCGGDLKPDQTLNLLASELVVKSDLLQS